MKIVIFGGDGFLGTKLKEIFSKRGHEVISVDHKKSSFYQIDATKLEEVENFLDSQKPEIVINTVALTDSVKCEKNPDLAMKLNFDATKNISDASKKINSKLFFISSSYVFDGEKGEYVEEEPPTPSGVYAKTKFLAENELLKEKNNVIFRVDLLYGYNGKDSPNGVFGKILSNGEIQIGNPEQIRSPLFIEDIPPIVEKLYILKIGGLFHLSGPDRIKMKDFLLKLENLVRKDSKIKIMNDRDLLVPEKKDSSLNSKKINKLGQNFTKIDEALNLIKKKLQ